MSDKSKDQKIKQLEEEIQRLNDKLEDKSKTKQEANKFLASVTSRLVLGKNLKASLSDLYNELPLNVKRETLANVTAAVIKRLTRFWWLGLIFILIPLIQTIILFQQNKLFNIQNERIEQQTHLIEADRRSSLVFLMNNIMDKIDEELKDAEDIPYHSSRKLSQLTIGRIAALSQSMKPFRYLDNGTLIAKPLSPERGQLLLALVNAKLDTTQTYPSIFVKATFENSDLKYAKLDSSFLASVTLSGADLSGADLSGTNLSEANLRGTDLSEANLSEANLIKAGLRGADLRGAFFSEADLRLADLIKTDLRLAGFSGADLRGAFFSEADLRGAFFSGVDLRGTFFSEADLRGTFFSGAGTILKGSSVINRRYDLIDTLINDLEGIVLKAK